MRILLDTHIVVWAMMDRSRLSAAARREIDSATRIVVSAVVIWEVAIKAALGQIDIDVNRLLQALTLAGAEQLPVTWEHGRMVRDLPHHHRDPFDRLLIAQAQSEGLQLLTHDRILARYGSFVALV